MVTVRENCPCCRDAPCQEQEGGWKEPNLPPREGLFSPTLIPPDLGTALGLPWGSALDFPGGQHPERWSCCPGLLHGPRPGGFHLSPQTAGSAHPAVAEGTNGSHGKGDGGRVLPRDLALPLWELDTPGMPLHSISHPRAGSPGTPVENSPSPVLQDAPAPAPRAASPGWLLSQGQGHS